MKALEEALGHAKTVSASSGPEPECIDSTRPAAVSATPAPHARDHYNHYETHERLLMAEAADTHGPTWVSRHSDLWGYSDKNHVPAPTISTRQRQLACGTLNAGQHRHRSASHPREVPSEIRQKVKELVQLDASHCGETTTDVVRDMFQQQGRDVSPAFLQTFRKEINYSLHRAALRSTAEVEQEDKLEQKIHELWDWLKAKREAGLELSNIITFDEKPVFVERFRRLIWREKNSGPATVKSQGKTRQRETVILPSKSCMRNNKFPIIWLFHGKKQKKVKVPAGYPTLVLFTETATMNGHALVHILKRAIMPNVSPGLNVLLLDAFRAHFGEAMQEYLQAEPCLEVKEIEAHLTK
jgi:hypothetical protein